MQAKFLWHILKVIAFSYWPTFVGVRENFHEKKNTKTWAEAQIAFLLTKETKWWMVLLPSRLWILESLLERYWGCWPFSLRVTASTHPAKPLRGNSWCSILILSHCCCPLVSVSTDYGESNMGSKGACHQIAFSYFWDDNPVVSNERYWVRVRYIRIQDSLRYQKEQIFRSQLILYIIP